MSLIEQQLKLIDASLTELEKLKNEVTRLEEIRKDIEDAKKGVGSLSTELSDVFEKVKTLSVSFVENLGSATKNYLDGNNTLFTTNLSELSIKIKEFEKEITRLLNTDFKKLFEDLQKVFLSQTKDDLGKVLIKFEEKANNLQSKIDDFKLQIDRLVNTDFEKLFEDLQKEFIDQTKSDLALELKKIDEKSKGLQAKIDDFKSQIDRLINTDFKTLFKDLQKIFIEQTIAELALELKKIDEKSEGLQAKIDDFKLQIDRLVNTDFEKLFKELQKEFIGQTRTDLAIELKKIDEKTLDIQCKIDELKKQIERLEKIDLEKHFDELQKTLAGIYGAINAVNLTLTNTIQTLTGVVQTLGYIQITIDINHKEAKQLLNSLSEATEKHLTEQDNQATQNVEVLESKIKTLSEQNQMLKKEARTNRIIQIAGFVAIIVILIYNLFENYQNVASISPEF